MAIITFENNTINIDGKSIQDMRQEEIPSIIKTTSFNDTNLVSRCLNTIQSAYRIKNRPGYDRFALDYLSEEFPEHDEAWNNFRDKSRTIDEHIDNLDPDRFAYLIFNVEKPQKLEISDMAAQYIVQNTVAESVLKTNMQTGIINLTSVNQIREDTLEEFTELIDGIEQQIRDIHYEISEYREENDLYEDNYYDDEDEYYDGYYDEYDDDYDEEYDYYNEDLHFDDEEESEEYSDEYEVNPTSYSTSNQEQYSQPLGDDDPWSDD